MSRSKNSTPAAPTMEAAASPPSGRTQFAIPDLLQLYRQTLYMAVKESDLAASGGAHYEEGLSGMGNDLDNWSNVEFDPPGCLRLSKKSGACQKIVSYWKKLLGSILTDRDPSSFGNHDRGVMTICKLLHKDFQVAVQAISKWNERDYPNIPTDQVKEKLSMNQLTFLCRRYHNDLTLIAHAFKSSIAMNDFKYLNPRHYGGLPVNHLFRSKIGRKSIYSGPFHLRTESQNTVNGRSLTRSKCQASCKGGGDITYSRSNEGPAADQLTETYPIDGSEYETAKEDSVSPTSTPVKSEKPKRTKKFDNENGTATPVSMAEGFDSMDKYSDRMLHRMPDMLAVSPMPSPLDPALTMFPMLNVNPRKSGMDQEHTLLKSLLPRSADHRSYAEQHQPVDLGRSSSHHSRGNTNGHGGHSRLPNGQNHKGRHDQHDEGRTEIQNLRFKNKKYVGMIMTLVQQLFALGQVPFIDLTSIDQEDQADQSSTSGSAAQSMSGRAPEMSRSQKPSGSGSYPVNGTSKHSSSRQPVLDPVPRRKVPKPMPNVTFDRTTMHWSGFPSSQAVNGHQSSSRPDPANMRIPAALPNGNRSVLSSLLESGSSGPAYAQDIKPSVSDTDTSSPSSGRSKRKNNPVKRGQGGLAPRLGASPDVSTSDETGSAGSNEAAKSVKASLFVPPVETNYIEKFPTHKRYREISESELNGNGKKKHGALQSMADSFLYANSGLTTLSGGSNHVNLGIDQFERPNIAVGAAVFGKLRDGLYPGEVVEKIDDSFVVAWMHANLTSTVRPEETFTLDEVLVAGKELLVRMVDEFQRCVLIECHRGRMYTVMNLFGDRRRCALADIVIPLLPEMPEETDALHRNLDVDVYGNAEQMGGVHGLVKSLGSKCPPRSERSGPFRNICFMLTGQKNNLFKGYDDEQIVALIQSGGGTVARKFEDLVACPGERYLVAPCTCTAPKFFQCLAANIPCLSFQWIIDSFTEHTKLDVTRYILPAGMDTEGVVLWTPRDDMFAETRVGLYDAASKLCETWFLALKTGNVDVQIVDPDSAAKDLQRVDVLIVESSCPASVKEAAESSGVHVVNENWLKQSLIHGKTQPSDNAEFLPLTE